MKIKTSILTFVFALMGTFLFANEFETSTYETTLTAQISLSEASDIAVETWTISEESCTISVTVELFGQSATVTVVADTCVEARRLLQQFFE